MSIEGIFFFYCKTTPKTFNSLSFFFLWISYSFVRFSYKFSCKYFRWISCSFVRFLPKFSIILCLLLVPNLSTKHLLDWINYFILLLSFLIFFFKFFISRYFDINKKKKKKVNHEMHSMDHEKSSLHPICRHLICTC